MRCILRQGDSQQVLTSLSDPQTKQAVAVMDGIARLLPHEGVDYRVDIYFKGTNDPSVQLGVIPLSDKGRSWAPYLKEMLEKYPPSFEYDGFMLLENPLEGNADLVGENNKEEKYEHKS